MITDLRYLFSWIFEEEETATLQLFYKSWNVISSINESVLFTAFVNTCLCIADRVSESPHSNDLANHSETFAEGRYFTHSVVTLTDANKIGLLKLTGTNQLA